jgi:hypothetical protein
MATAGSGRTFGTRHLTVLTSTKGVGAPDPSWRNLYLAGAFTAALCLLLSVLSIVTAQVTKLPGGAGTLPDAASTLRYIGANRIGFIIDEILIQGPVVLTIVTFMALYMALQHVGRAAAAVGAVLAIGSVLATLGYFAMPFALVYLSDQFATAATAADQAPIISASDGLLAQINSVIPAALLLPAGIILMSIPMLKGVFPRSVAYIGLVTGVAGIVSEALRPILGNLYGVYGVLLLAWLLAVTWKLFQLGRHRPTPSAAS